MKSVIHKGLVEEVILELFSERCTRGMQVGRPRLVRTVKERSSYVMKQSTDTVGDKAEVVCDIYKTSSVPSLQFHVTGLLSIEAGTEGNLSLSLRCLSSISFCS